MKRLITLGILFLVLQSNVVAASLDCSISERITLENTSVETKTFTFQRGMHEGFVHASPGQSVTVDVIECH